MEDASSLPCKFCALAKVYWFAFNPLASMHVPHCCVDL